MKWHKRAVSLSAPAVAAVAATLVFSLGMSGGCTWIKKSASSAKSGVPTPREFKPEDLAILLPVPRAIFQTSYTSNDGSLTDLSHSLVPFSAIVKEELYSKIVAEIVRPTTETNPLAEAAFATSLTATPLHEWFVTGVRFVPCGTGRFPLPAPWNVETTPAGPSILELSCAPRIQLSVQRFSRMTCQDCNGQPTSDDKALHLNFDFWGDLDESVRAEVTAARVRTVASLALLLEGGKLDASAAAKVVSEEFAPSGMQATLARLRLLMLQRVDAIRDPHASGPLRLNYGATLALPRLRDYLTKEFAASTTLQSLTHSFSLSGAEPGFSEKWVFGTLAFDRAPGVPGGPDHNVDTSVRRVALKTFVAEASGRARSLSAGDIESFTDTPGSKTAIDRELRSSLALLTAPSAPEIFARTALQAYANLHIEPTTSKVAVESIPSQEMTLPSRKATLQQGYDASLDVEQHDITSPSCVSCHVSTAVRIEQSLAPVPGAVSRDESLGLSNLDLTAVGANAKVTQVQFKQTWLLRAFGYVGQVPAIADRTVREVDEDVRRANLYLQKDPLLKGL